MSAQRQYTEAELKAYAQGLSRAEAICQERSKGRTSQNAEAIRREIMNTRLMAAHNHGIDIPNPNLVAGAFKGVSRLTILGELTAAALILGAPFAAFWLIYWLTGQPVRFG